MLVKRIAACPDVFNRGRDAVHCEQLDSLVAHELVGIVAEGKPDGVLAVAVVESAFDDSGHLSLDLLGGGVISGVLPMKPTSALWLPLPSVRWKARIGLSRPPTSLQLVISPE